MQIGEFEDDKVSLGINDCMMIPTSAKDFYEDLDILFNNFKPSNKEVEQFYINSDIVIRSFDDTIGLKKYAYRTNSSSKRNLSKFWNLLYARVGLKKKTGIILEISVRFNNIVGKQELIKSEDYGGRKSI